MSEQPFTSKKPWVHRRRHSDMLTNSPWPHPASFWPTVLNKKWKQDRRIARLIVSIRLRQKSVSLFCILWICIYSTYLRKKKGKRRGSKRNNQKTKLPVLTSKTLEAPHSWGNGGLDILSTKRKYWHWQLRFPDPIAFAINLSQSRAGHGYGRNSDAKL